MVSTGDRSAKIRTYNYPQGRVTDHRINFTLYNLQAVMDGEIDEIIEKLQIEENTERLKESGLVTRIFLLLRMLSGGISEILRRCMPKLFWKLLLSIRSRWLPIWEKIR